MHHSISHPTVSDCRYTLLIIIFSVKALASSLGFSDVSLNSLDATSDRDFIAEYMMWASLLMTHASQFAEDMIIMNMSRCMEMSDAYCTGSSLMPQKKNPGLTMISTTCYVGRQYSI